MAHIRRSAIYLFSFVASRSRKEKAFARNQEGARKMIERLFGILFKRFQILYRPCRQWHVSDMGQIVKACATLHNMIEESKKETSTGGRAVRIANEHNAIVVMDEMPVLQPAESVDTASAFWQQHLEGVNDNAERFELQLALVDYAWSGAAIPLSLRGGYLRPCRPASYTAAACGGTSGRTASRTCAAHGGTFGGVARTCAARGGFSSGTAADPQ